jgi:hypothetical protein
LVSVKSEEAAVPPPAILPATTLSAGGAGSSDVPEASKTECPLTGAALPAADAIPPKTELQEAEAVAATAAAAGAAAAAAVAAAPSPPSEPAVRVMARSEHQFIPKCSHRHPLRRTACAAGSAATDDEPLECDACSAIIQPADPRWSCFPCDYDLCELCLLSKCGGAAYLGLLSDSEKARDSADARATIAEERARIFQAKLASAEKAQQQQGKAAAVTERRAAEAKVAAAEERRAAAEEEVGRLQKEVTERRMRSKANLEKMYDARKERDEARALIEGRAAEDAKLIEEQRGKAEDATRQLTVARQQLACAFGDPDALADVSLEEVEQLETLCLAGLSKIHERRAHLAVEEATERQKRLDCAVCLTNERSVAYGPCGHIACCRECAPKVDQCPLCKRGVAQRIPVFLP